MPPKKSNTKSTKQNTKPKDVKHSSRAQKPKDQKQSKPKQSKQSEIDEVDYGDEQDSKQADELEELEELDELNGEQDDLEKLPDLVAQNPTMQLTEKYEYKPIITQEIVVIDPVNRITSEVMTMFEIAEVIGIRAQQIDNGGPCFTDVQDLTEPLDMARKELLDKKCPLTIKRQITDKICELWNVNEMAVPPELVN